VGLRSKTHAVLLALKVRIVLGWYMDGQYRRTETHPEFTALDRRTRVVSTKDVQDRRSCWNCDCRIDLRRQGAQVGRVITRRIRGDAH
jgi:hypothetical protein